MTLAPIILFVYNRPLHTKQTLEALSKNDLADQSILYIYADGPKADSSEEQLKNIQKTREVIRTKQWCKEVHYVESDINKGLAKSIITGVSEVVQKHGKIIVLEDDLSTSPHFLTFMNEALNEYESIQNVYSVNGFMFPLSNYTNEHSSKLLPYTSTWGWGTWKESWGVFSENLTYKEILKQDKNIQARFNLVDYDYTHMLDFQNNSWGIKWYYSVFEKHGLGVFPTQSLVYNIGMDGSGTNNDDQGIELKLCNRKIEVCNNIDIDFEFFSNYLEYFSSPPPSNSVLRKIKNKIKGYFKS